MCIRDRFITQEGVYDMNDSNAKTMYETVPAAAELNKVPDVYKRQGFCSYRKAVFEVKINPAKVFEAFCGNLR